MDRSQEPKLSVNIDFWDGRSRRGGPEEVDEWWQIQDGECDTEQPGGFGPARVVFARPDGWDPLSDAQVAATTIRDDSGRTVHEGRVTGTPKTGVNTVEMQIEGWSKSLSDNKAASAIFRDADFGSWSGATSARKAVLAAFNQGAIDMSVVTDPGSGAPYMALAEDGAAPGSQRVEACYDAGPANRIRSLYRAWKVVTTGSVGVADANWALFAEIDTADNFAVAGDSLNTTPIGASGASTLVATALDRRYAHLMLTYSPVLPSGHYEVGITNIAVYCTDVTKRGVEPNGGLYVGDMARYAVGKWAPLVSMTSDSVESTSFAVPHAVFKDPGPVRNMVEALALFGGNSFYPLDWGTYEGRTFFLRSPGTYGNDWRIRLDEGAENQDQGMDSSERLNGVIVTYNPGDGSTRSVGPPGSGADTETSNLYISDPAHPWTRAGLKNWDLYDAGVTSTAGATLIGQVILVNANRKKWRGSVTLKGAQRTQAGIWLPPYMVRSGDRGVVEDDLDPAERSIIGTSYNFRTGQNKVDAGADPDRLPALLARAGVVLVGKV